MEITTLAGVTRDISVSEIIQGPKESAYSKNTSLLVVRGLGCMFVDEECEHLKQRIKQEKENN